MGKMEGFDGRAVKDGKRKNCFHVNKRQDQRQVKGGWKVGNVGINGE